MGIFGNTDTTQTGTNSGTTSGSLFNALSGITRGGTTTTGRVDPYRGATPLLSTTLKDAMSLYKRGGLNPYVNPSNATQTALSGMGTVAMRGQPSLNTALSTFQGFAGGGNQVGTAGQDNIYSEALGPSYSEGNLGGVARGDFLNREDPNFERVLGAASEKAETAARMAAGAKGRYGGDYAQTEVGRTVGDLQAGARLDQYNTERSRQVEANSLMDQMRQAGLGLGLNAANSSTAVQADNRNRQLSAAGGVGEAYDNTLDPYRALEHIGQVRDADALKKAGTGSANLASLAQLLGVANPFSSTTGTTKTKGTQDTVNTGTQTGTQTGSTTGTAQGPDNTVGEIAGLGLTGASLLKLLKGAGGVSGLFQGLL